MTTQLLAALRESLNDPDLSLECFHAQGNHLAWKVLQPAINRVSFLRVEDGPERDDYLDVESELLQRVRHPLSPTPQCIACDTGRTVVPFAWQLIEYLPEPNLQHRKKRGEWDETLIAPQIGRAIATYQRVEVSGYGPFQPAVLRESKQLRGWHNQYADFFMLRLDEHLHHLSSGSLLTPAQQDKVRGLIQEHASLLDLSKPCLVHKDMALWNLLGLRDRITAVIDWDDAIGGDPVDDLALLGCFFDRPFLNGVLDGYESIKPRPENFEARFWMHVLRNLIFKAVIRLRGGYFEQDDRFFLVDSGCSGADLRRETQQRLCDAIDLLQHYSKRPVFS
ncbi:Ser/Thr protein kinase RdoA (MazF antagonist) [Planctomycetales bacterium 10988]|nr:Ser/Thr protein kinase RdoA (MazF antagonist) [Planctomycetales bacterium 10988]